MKQDGRQNKAENIVLKNSDKLLRKKQAFYGR